MTDIFLNTRKRSRSSEEEEFLPLSKKINNLHINQWNAFTKSETEAGFLQAQPNAPPPQPWPPAYAPDLSSEENPFYYENNKLLYDLYLERAHRNGY